MGSEGNSNDSREQCLIIHLVWLTDLFWENGNKTVAVVLQGLAG